MILYIIYFYIIKKLKFYQEQACQFYQEDHSRQLHHKYWYSENFHNYSKCFFFILRIITYKN